MTAYELSLRIPDWVPYASIVVFGFAWPALGYALGWHKKDSSAA